MIKDLKILAVIPARGGSKGIPGKNLRPLAGRSLLEWTIKSTQKSKYIDRLILSSDDKSIIEEAKRLGCDVPFVRPSDLAQDSTPGIVPVLHALENVPGYDHLLLLQPTSPLRTAEDIDSAIEFGIGESAPSVVSVCESSESPFWMFKIDDGNKMTPMIKNEYTSRQQMPKVYSLNGAIYFAKTNWVKEKKSFLSDETLAFVMPQERSIDIDTELDLVLAEELLRRRS